MLLEPQPTRRFSLPFTSCPTTCCLESRCTINCLLCLPIFLLGCPTRPRSSHTTSCTTSFLVTCTWILICLLDMKGGFVEHAWQVVFAIFQIFFYALRPMFITQIKFTYVHLVNVVFQLIFDHVMVTYWGGRRWGTLL